MDDQVEALSKALGPKATERIYLAMLNAEGIFSVMHSLRWWTEAPGGSRNKRGWIVAFEGEVQTGTGLPNLWRFEELDDHLFRLLTLPQVLLSNTARFYENETNDEYYRTTVVPDKEGPGRVPACGRLIPIPVEWAPMFLDYPKAGTAFCRLVDLVNSVDRAERDKFTYLARSMAYACLSANKGEQHMSTMSIQWKRMVMSRPTKMWAQSVWTGPPSPDEAKEDCPRTTACPPTISDFSKVFGGQARRTAITVLVSSSQRSGTIRVTTVLQSQKEVGPPREVPQPAAVSVSVIGGGTTNPPDIIAIIRTMMEAQLAANVAMSAASNANMIAFHTAMAQAPAAKNGDKDSKLTVAKKKILQACCKHADKDTFTTLGVYLDMDMEGGTTDALGRILRRRMKSIVGSLHKSNIYVTPQLVATKKLLSFAANGDKTHAGCTKGITLFGTPWQLVKAMNEDTAEEGYFDQATLKFPADIRKHAASAKVELPTTHLGLVRVLNNYTRLLEVLFGDDCDHLVHVRAIRDGLEDNKTDLESKITQSLCLHLLWRIHHDARQFVMACESWEDGEILPRSQLGLTVRHLVDNCAIQLMIMCSVAAFLGADADAPVRRGAGPARVCTPTVGSKPSTNAAIPPLCKTAVANFVKLFPTLSVMDMVKQGGIKFGAVQIRGKGDCSNFNLLGKCTNPNCTYAHKPAKVGKERQVAVAKSVDQAVAKMKGASPA